MTEALTREDVAKLLEDPSPRNRADLAIKVAGQMDTGQLSLEERRLAEQIVRAIAADVAVMVREALALNLKHWRQLPNDVALAMARDVDRVALPILEFSEVLTDADLIALVRESNEVKQSAIARRAKVSRPVAQALIDTRNPRVVGILMANEGADLSDRQIGQVVDRFAHVETVQEALVRRSMLPMAVGERLVAHLSDRLREHLVTHHELSPDTASELVLRAREQATLNLISNRERQYDVGPLVEQLARNARLTPFLVLRALCFGDIMFFEAALAALARVPVENARILIHDAGPLGLQSIYMRAHMPEALLGAVRMALAIAVEMKLSGADDNREQFAKNLIQRILTQCEDLRPEDADYLLGKLDDLVPVAAA